MLLPHMDSGRERRRHPRYDAPNLPGVVDGVHPVQALKLSAGGALVYLRQELALGCRVVVAMELGEQVFRSAADVVFVGPDVADQTGEGYRVGLAFADTAPGDQAALDRFIAAELASNESR